jgi:hypothetical protein
MVSKPDTTAAKSQEVYAKREHIDEKPRKVRRITRACDYCHRRSIKCTVSQNINDERCQNCYEFAQPCTYDRPTRRRGAKRRSPSPEAANGYGEHGKKAMGTPGSTKNLVDQWPQVGFTTYGHARVSKSQGKDWSPPELASQVMIMNLVEIYFEIVYPL